MAPDSVESRIADVLKPRNRQRFCKIAWVAMRNANVVLDRGRGEV